MYDYLIVGAGFFGSTFARLATDAGKRCLVIDARSHIAGNAYTKKIEGIDVHEYGPHIFHTNNKEIWDFVNRFAEFNNFVLTPKVSNNGRLYSLPFNMHTFNELWGCITPEQAQEKIKSQIVNPKSGTPSNLEEQALSLVGVDLYEKIIKGYTTKQWQRDPKDLPAFIIKRLPIRYTYDNNYFNDRYQGIPVEGYTKMFENMLEGIEVRTNQNYFENKNTWDSMAAHIIFTGKIDEYFDYEFGELEYRTLDFKHSVLDVENFQGVAQVNYPNDDVPYTRIVEHKHFTGIKTANTVITKEIPGIWNRGKIPYYPINDNTNNSIYEKYREKADTLRNVTFGGRLSEYKYYDMHQVIGSAMKAFKMM